MLPETIRQRLASEFRFAADRMAEESDIDAKLYFFSVFFGEAQRSLNLVWDGQLALVQVVTQSVYREINQRVVQVASGQDRIVGLHEAIPTELTKAGDDLASVFEADETDGAELLRILSKMATLGYITTGNGKYLTLRGKIEV